MTTSNRISFAQHGIKKESFSPAVLEVVQTLLEHDFQAYIVGGAVRDLLLGITPKDFDVATNATPEETCKIFKRAQIIGRRFQIVHVRSHHETIEVTTFRTIVEGTKKQTRQGLLLSDNQFGSLEEDAQRRDFSINALYYDIQTQTILDFCNGIDAVKYKELRCIGDPETRYREDPVRMLRAIRLKAKLNLGIEKPSELIINEHGYLLQQVSHARLFDEMLKLFMNGYAEKTFAELYHYGILDELVPSALHHYEKKPIYQTFFKMALVNSDQRVKANKPITPAFFIAVFLWPEMQDKFNFISSKNKKLNKQQAWLECAHSTLMEQHHITSIPKRFQTTIQEIWTLQKRLVKNAKKEKDALKLLEHDRFRAAYDFLLLREDSKETHTQLAGWWTDFQVQHSDVLEKAKQARKKRIAQYRNKQKQKRRTRRR